MAFLIPRCSALAELSETHQWGFLDTEMGGAAMLAVCTKILPISAVPRPTEYVDCFNLVERSAVASLTGAQVKLHQHVYPPNMYGRVGAKYNMMPQFHT